MSLYATATTRKPSSLSSAPIACGVTRCARRQGADVSPSTSSRVQTASISSTAPLQIRTWCVSGSTTTDIRRRGKSNGISSILRVGAVKLQVLAELDMLQHGHVEQVLQVRTGSSCSGRRIAAPHRPPRRRMSTWRFENDPVLRQRAGLVGAQHIHRAEILDRVEALDDDLLARHRHAPLARLTVTIIGSISGVRPTATARAKSSASSQSPLVRPLIRNTSGHHHQHEPDHQPGERLTPLSKLVGTRSPAIASASCAEIGPAAREHDDRRRRAAHHVVPMKQMLGRSNGSRGSRRDAWPNFSDRHAPRRSAPTD